MVLTFKLFKLNLSYIILLLYILLCLVDFKGYEKIFSNINIKFY